MVLRWISAAGLLALALAGSPALADDEGFDRFFPSEVRVVHASPAPTPAVDVVVDDALVLFQNVPFGAATEYRSVAPSVYNVKVVETGTPGPAVIDTDLSLFYGDDYTVVATGLFPDIEPIVLEDDNSRVMPFSARVRFFHGSPDTGPISVRAVDGPVWVESLSYQSASPYVMVPAGPYDLEVSVLGTDISVVIPAGLPGGSTVTVFAIGLLGDSSLQFLPTVDSTRDRRGRDGFGDDDGPDLDDLVDPDESALIRQLRGSR